MFRFTIALFVGLLAGTAQAKKMMHLNYDVTFRDVYDQTSAASFFGDSRLLDARLFVMTEDSTFEAPANPVLNPLPTTLLINRLEGTVTVVGNDLQSYPARMTYAEDDRSIESLEILTPNSNSRAFLQVEMDKWQAEIMSHLKKNNVEIRTVSSTSSPYICKRARKKLICESKLNLFVGVIMN